MNAQADHASISAGEIARPCSDPQKICVIRSRRAIRSKIIEILIPDKREQAENDEVSINCTYYL